MHSFLSKAMKEKEKIQATVHGTKNDYMYTGTVKEINDAGIITQNSNCTVLIHWKDLGSVAKA